MERNGIVDQKALSLLLIRQGLERTMFLIGQAKGFTLHRLKVQRLIEILRDKEKDDEGKFKALDAFQKILFGMNSITDFPVILHRKSKHSPLWLKHQIRSEADYLWKRIEDLKTLKV